ncbi:MAG: undecaprenyl-phosphate glucose phosphotransferase [Lachnospiraceae bacterium]|nr:undecaprenyl-phosphate glucose phosphotransferase [Lachnospiraceae bacterium]
MIEENQKFLNRLLVILDAAVIGISFLGAWFVRFRTNLLGVHIEVISRSVYVIVFGMLLAVMLLLYSAFNLYSKRMMRIRTLLSNIVMANAVGVLVFSTLIYIIKIVDFSRGMFIFFFAANTFLEAVERYMVRWYLTRRWISGRNIRQVLLVGYSRAAEQYIDRVKANPQWGYRIRGILDDRVKAGTEYRGIRVIGRIENLMVILPENHLDEIAITLGLSEYARLEDIVMRCEKSGVHTKFIPDYNNIIPTRPYTEDVMGLPVINIRHVPLSNTFPALMKRLTDILGSAFAIILFSPIMLFCAIGTKLSSPGPVIFRQERVGLHNRPFQMYKFRTMIVQKEEDEKKAWTVKDDPRVTKIGGFMRRHNLDELPQFFNILKGDMSLVGPRPERPFFVERFQEEVPRYMIKHQVRPGLTGWAQINGLRGDTSIKKRIEYDLYYIENWTYVLDIKILILTLIGRNVNKNAY